MGIGVRRRIGLGLRDLAVRARVLRYEPSVWTMDRWGSAYGGGSLDYFASVVELGRYSVLAGYVGHFGRGASMLDVGCGTGLLRSRIADEWIGRYIGVDPTVEAIERARTLDAPQTTFVVGTMDDVRDQGPFDIVLCNEVISMVPDGAAFADDLVSVTRPGGHLLTSIWRHPGDRVLWQLLDDRFERVDTVELRNPANRIGVDGWRVTCHRRAS